MKARWTLAIEDADTHQQHELDLRPDDTIALEWRNPQTSEKGGFTFTFEIPRLYRNEQLLNSVYPGLEGYIARIAGIPGMDIRGHLKRTGTSREAIACELTLTKTGAQHEHIDYQPFAQRYGGIHTKGAIYESDYDPSTSSWGNQHEFHYLVYIDLEWLCRMPHEPVDYTDVPPALRGLAVYVGQSYAGVANYTGLQALGVYETLGYTLIRRNGHLRFVDRLAGGGATTSPARRYGTAYNLRDADPKTGGQEGPSPQYAACIFSHDLPKIEDSTFSKYYEGHKYRMGFHNPAIYGRMGAYRNDAVSRARLRRIHAEFTGYDNDNYYFWTSIAPQGAAGSLFLAKVGELDPQATNPYAMMATLDDPIAPAAPGHQWVNALSLELTPGHATITEAQVLEQA